MEALLQLDRLWDELLPAEQARMVQLLVEPVDVRMHSVEVRRRPNELAGLVREVAGSRRAAAAAGRQRMVKALARAFRRRRMLG